jgi:hypothetical protein
MVSVIKSIVLGLLGGSLYGLFFIWEKKYCLLRGTGNFLFLSGLPLLRFVMFLALFICTYQYFMNHIVWVFVSFLCAFWSALLLFSARMRREN